MQTKGPAKVIGQVFDLSRFEDPEALFFKAICSQCGDIRIMEGRCKRCQNKRIKRMKLDQQKLALGIQPLQKDPIREEYNRIFRDYKDGIHPKTNERDLLKNKNMSLLVALLELRNCFQKNLAGEYAIPLHNQERLTRILKAIDMMQGGWLAKWITGNRLHTLIDKFITGELGTTWHP